LSGSAGFAIDTIEINEISRQKRGNREFRVKRRRTAYGNRHVIRPLKQKFVMPFGFGRLWWAIRTSYIPGQVLRRRVEAFHCILSQSM
jgi:hypothetical protein